MKQKIILENLYHRDTDCIGIRFVKDFELNSLVKQIPEVKFSKTNGCWYVANGSTTLKTILETMRHKAWVDYSKLRKREAALAGQVRNAVILKRECPTEYIEQLDRMRYSPNTKKTYQGLFSQFINYFPETDIEKITDDQINSFMKYLLDTRKVSASTQNQAINAIKFYYERVKNNLAKYMLWNDRLKKANCQRC
jgi:integrase/recombinase XerD